MEKKLPIAITLFHVLLSGLSSYATWPLKTIAGLEIESIVVAVIAAAIGTILGLVKVVNRKLAARMIACGVLFVAAVGTYSLILAQPGASAFQLFLALFLLFILLLIFFYVITYLETALFRTWKTRKTAK